MWVARKCGGDKCGDSFCIENILLYPLDMQYYAGALHNLRQGQL